MRLSGRVQIACGGLDKASTRRRQALAKEDQEVQVICAGVANEKWQSVSIWNRVRDEIIGRANPLPRKVNVARLSIIVPFLGANEASENTLASVLQNRPDGSDIVVVHAGPYDDPWDIGDEVTFVEQPATSSLIDLLNASLHEISGRVVHVLQPGIEVEEGWADIALSHFDNPDVATVAPVHLISPDELRVVSRGVSYSAGGSRYLRGAGQAYENGRVRPSRILGPTLQAGFYRTRILQTLGGWDSLMGDHLADVDLALTLQDAGYRSVCAESCRVYGSASDVPVGSFTQGRCAERLFLRHAPQQGWFRSLLAHPFAVAWNMLADLPHPGAITQLFGRMIALTEFSKLRAGYDQADDDVGESPDHSPATSRPQMSESPATETNPEQRRRAA